MCRGGKWACSRAWLLLFFLSFIKNIIIVKIPSFKNFLRELLYNLIWILWGEKKSCLISTRWPMVGKITQAATTTSTCPSNDTDTDKLINLKSSHLSLPACLCSPLACSIIKSFSQVFSLWPYVLYMTELTSTNNKCLSYPGTALQLSVSLVYDDPAIITIKQPGSFPTFTSIH